MWSRSILPYDIIALIIDIVGEDEDTELLKELALVSHSFNQICSKHIFATVELHDASLSHWDDGLNWHAASSKKRFVKLLKSRPGVVKYIRKLTYEVSHNEFRFLNDDHRLSRVLPNLLRTIPHLNCLTIDGSKLDWNTLDPSLSSAFLYLMHLPTVNHVDLSFIQNFPLSSFARSVNLRRLDICDVEPPEEEIIVQSEMMPKFRELLSIKSAMLTSRLLHAKTQDGHPAFNFMDLKQLSICLADEQNILYLLKYAPVLEKLHLTTLESDQSLERLHDMLSACAGTLKVLDLTLLLHKEHDGSLNLPFKGLCEGLEEMVGNNKLEALSLEVELTRDETGDDIGCMIQSVEKVLVKPGWPALKQVSFKVSVSCCLVRDSAELAEELQYLLPSTYLTHISKLDSVAFDFSSYVENCYLHVH